MGSKREGGPMKAGAITLTPSGRLTEHTAHIDVRGEDVPKLTYRNGRGQRVNFTPMKLVVTWQYSWTIGGWHVLEVKALGRSGVQDIVVRFRDPDVAPEWVRDAVKLAAPNLEVPKPRKPINEAGEIT
jgi:hypothetical protein